jgi:hypothetical protein
MPTTNWDALFEDAGNVDDTPPPPGTYLCEIETGEWATTAAGKDMFKYRARIVGGPQKNKALFGNIVISPENPRAVAIGLRHLAAIGLTKELLKSLTAEEQEERVIGNEVQIETENREWKGEVRADVKNIKPSGNVSNDRPPSANTPPPAASDPNTPPPAAPFSSDKD